MSAVLPKLGPLFYPSSARIPASKSNASAFISQLLSVSASPASRMPVFGKYLAALVEMAPVRNLNAVRAPAVGGLHTEPAAPANNKKSTVRPKLATTGRGAGRPASRPAARRKKKVKTKTSYYVKSTTNTFSLVKNTAERSEKTFADRQR